MAEELMVTPESVIPKVLAERIRLTPDRLVVIERDIRLTYEAFGKCVNQLAAALQGLDIQLGEKIAILLPSGANLLY